VDHDARQVGLAAGEFRSYDMARRTAQRHRNEIRRYTGFRECSVADAEKLAFWLARQMAESERREDRVREKLVARCRRELIEPPTSDRVTEIVRSALRQAEQTLVTRVAARLDRGPVGRLEALVAVEDRPRRRSPRRAGHDQDRPRERQSRLPAHRAGKPGSRAPAKPGRPGRGSGMGGLACQSS